VGRQQASQPRACVRACRRALAFNALARRTDRTEGGTDRPVSRAADRRVGAQCLARAHARPRELRVHARVQLVTSGTVWPTTVQVCKCNVASSGVVYVHVRHACGARADRLAARISTHRARIGFIEAASRWLRATTTMGVFVSCALNFRPITLKRILSFRSIK
jgi:hypothetical protein